MDDIKFPKDFWWGTSLSSHQAEGGNNNSWTRWEETHGNIKNGHRAGQAADHWNRFETDFDNLVWLNANTHRMSIEWSRLEPQPGVWDEKAAQHYREMLQALKQRGIRPVLCLFHFTLPLWAEDAGGFESQEVIKAFLKFTKKSAEVFGDLVHDWLTLNEPVVYALGAYGAGLTPPGVKDLKRAITVIVNLIKVHAEMYHILKIRNPHFRVSFAQHLRVFTPKSEYSFLDRWGAKLANNVFNWSWYDAIQTGKIQVHIPMVLKVDEDFPAALGALDYIGFNYYGRDLLSVNPFSRQKFFVAAAQTDRKSDMGWEIFPEGLAYLLHSIKKRKLDNYPLLMTENGLADEQDFHRSQFIYEHLNIFLTTAEALKLKPMGYLHWSLIDNFEWIDGFYPRFGLFHVDYKSHVRTARESARYFKELGRLKTLIAPAEKP